MTLEPQAQALFEALVEAAVLRPIDVQLARTLGRIGADESAALRLAAALAHRVVANGDVAIDLADALAAAPLALDRSQNRSQNRGARNRGSQNRSARELGEARVMELGWPALEPWLRALEQSPLVDVVAESARHAEPGADDRPLVKVGTKLYLRRYFEHEMGLAEALASRARAQAEVRDAERLRASLDLLFPPPATADAAPDLQREGAVMALRSRLAILSGGPGTGKTRTVARILYLFVEQAAAAGLPAPRVMLAAPTGKAAARLDESIRQERAGMLALEGIAPELVERIPMGARTVHRTLGVLGGNVLKLRHDAEHPLPAEVVVVDEASMVDLPLMRRLVAAVPAQATLVLLGDKDQLTSVEAGSVLGQLAEAAEASEAGEREAPAGRSSIGRCFVHFDKTYRYADDSGIAQLAAAIRRGDAARAAQLLASDHEDIVWHECAAADPPPAFDAILGAADGYAAFLAEGLDDAARLHAFGKLRVLAALRDGARGVSGLNRRIERALAKAKRLEPESGPYLHRPVLVTTNDYDLRLFNGDVGLLVRRAASDPPQRSPRLAACFPGSEEGQLRHFSPARLPSHQTCLAMTVHKAQGSEFDRVVLVLPEEPSPVLTRELLYTAVSRAKSRVDIFGAMPVLRAGIEAKTRRMGRLAELLVDPQHAPRV